MQHLRAHARIAGALQDAAAAAADRIAQRRIAERELVIAVRVVLVLARVAPRLRKLRRKEIRNLRSPLGPSRFLFAQWAARSVEYGALNSVFVVSGTSGS